MSKKLEEYGKKKSCAITAAKRLADFLGEQMIKEKGLTCTYIISKFPFGAPITDRVIPTAIFNITDESVKLAYLRKWCKGQHSASKNNKEISSNSDEMNIRTLIDWEYYKDRLASVIQKIITIPACIQKIINPVPRIANPDWIEKALKENNSSNKQSRITNLFKKSQNPNNLSQTQDIENISQPSNSLSVLTPIVHKRLAIHFISLRNYLISIDLI